MSISHTMIKIKPTKLLMRFLVWRLKHISDSNFILIVASIIGMVAGIAAVSLKTTVHFIQHFLENQRELISFNYFYLIFPLIGISLTVLVAKHLFKEKLGHGITHILYAISKNSSIMRKTQMYSRMVTSAITVG
ncbi:MAG: CIC family chloride channel protein, partial [Cyclobacteriaceae bacterium]